MYMLFWKNDDRPMGEVIPPEPVVINFVTDTDNFFAIRFTHVCLKQRCSTEVLRSAGIALH